MSAQAEQPQAGRADEGEQAELNDFGKLAFHFLKFGQNATDNMSKAFGDMTLEQWIRIVIIVGAYLLLRPHIMKLMNRAHVNKMVRDDNKAKAEISPNELRGGKSHPMFGDAEGDDDEDEDEAQASGADWGAKARTRQRAMLKQLMEAEERRRAEEESDEEIADLLVD